MIKSREHQELESSCRLTFHVCKAVFEDQNSYAVVYGIKGVDEVGNLRVHIREVSESLLRVRRLVRRLNGSVFSQAHLMDLIDQYLEEEEKEESKGGVRV
ncbi:MAG: hypothetical protein HFF16_08220 [Angelakisella sp.]|jgi:hypothetical protein|nr:hypothetical protein [Angelakisella sp.]